MKWKKRKSQVAVVVVVQCYGNFLLKLPPDAMNNEQ